MAKGNNNNKKKNPKVLHMIETQPLCLLYFTLLFLPQHELDLEKAQQDKSWPTSH